MRPDGFTLAATTNDLTREPKVRDVADVVEFRMDKAADPIEQLDAYEGELPIVATNRAEWSGGEASEDGRLDRLVTASGFDAVAMADVELETAREQSEVVAAVRENGAEAIVSHHDFDATPAPDALAATFEECSELGDVAKVATFAADYGDALRMLGAVHEATRVGRRVAGIAMGGLGSHTRVVAPFYGSALGYAPVASDTSEYAPGQLPLGQLASMIETLRAAESPGSRNGVREEGPTPSDVPGPE